MLDFMGFKAFRLKGFVTHAAAGTLVGDSGSLLDHFLPVDSVLDLKLPDSFQFALDFNDVRPFPFQLVDVSAVLVDPVGLLGDVGAVAALVGLGLEVKRPVVHPQVRLCLETLAAKFATVLLFRLVDKLQIKDKNFKNNSKFY